MCPELIIKVDTANNNIYHIDLKAIPEDQTNLLSQTINNILL